MPPARHAGVQTGYCTKVALHFTPPSLPLDYRFLRFLTARGNLSLTPQPPRVTYRPENGSVKRQDQFHNGAGIWPELVASDPLLLVSLSVVSGVAFRGSCLLRFYMLCCMRAHSVCASCPPISTASATTDSYSPSQIDNIRSRENCLGRLQGNILRHSWGRSFTVRARV